MTYSVEEKRAKKTEYMREWRAKNKERELQIQRDCYARNKEDRQRRMKAARDGNLEKAKSEHNARYVRRREDPAYLMAQREKHRDYMRHRRMVMKAPLALYYAVESQLIYDFCPDGSEVDHIEPIGGKNATGLHVPWNLQYLTVSENRIKRNIEDRHK
jgi:hypothetical protein